MDISKNSSKSDYTLVQGELNVENVQEIWKKKEVKGIMINEKEQ